MPNISCEPLLQYSRGAEHGDMFRDAGITQRKR